MKLGRSPLEWPSFRVRVACTHFTVSCASRRKAALRLGVLTSALAITLASLSSIHPTVASASTALGSRVNTNNEPAAKALSQDSSDGANYTKYAADISADNPIANLPLDDTSNSSNVGILVGNWGLISLTYDSSTGDAVLYLDGNEVRSAQSTGSLAASTSELRISGWNFHAAQVSFLDTALSASQIQRLYGASGAAQYTSDLQADGALVANFPLDDSSTIAVDATRNGNDGTYNHCDEVWNPVTGQWFCDWGQGAPGPFGADGPHSTDPQNGEFVMFPTNTAAPLADWSPSAFTVNAWVNFNYSSSSIQVGSGNGFSEEGPNSPGNWGFTVAPAGTPAGNTTAVISTTTGDVTHIAAPATDTTGNGNDGTYWGDYTQGITGPFGRNGPKATAIGYDGGVLVPNTANSELSDWSPTSFTVNGWIQPGMDLISSFFSNEGIDLDEWGDSVSVYIALPTPVEIYLPAYLPANLWMLITLSYDSATGDVVFYVDGTPVETATGSGSVIASAGGFDIASHYTFADPAGAQIALFDHALTASQVNQLAEDGGVAGKAPLSAFGIGEGDAGRTCTTCMSSRPVNYASGDFSHTFTDVSVPGRGPNLDLTRTYNSLSASTSGMFGYGWSSSYSEKLTNNSDGSVTVTEDDGSQVTAEPNGSGGYSVPSWADSTLTQNADGSWTFVRQRMTTYTFNPSGQLTAIMDRNGYVTSLYYNSSGQLVAVTDPEGRTMNFSYGSNGPVSEVTDPAGNSTSYSYDANGDLTSVTDPMGRVTSFTYDPNHLLLTMTDPNGGVTTNVYDSSGRVTSQTDPAGLTTTFSYQGNSFSPLGGVTTITDPHRNVETQNYLNGELVADTKGAWTSSASTWTYTYDENTNGVTSETDPDGNTTYSTYDSDGNLASKTDALGNTTTHNYNDLDEPLTVTDPLGITTTYTYDSNGNVLTKTLSGSGGSPSETTSYTYGDTTHPGDLTGVKDPAGHVTDYTYDSYGDVATTTTHPSSSTSNTTSYVYDVLGQEVCEASANATVARVSCPGAGQPRTGDTTTYAYDADGELTSETDPLGNTTTSAYDADGNQTQVTDPLGNVTLTTYDADGRTTQVTTGYGSSVASTTTYAYDIAPGSGACVASVAGATYCTTTTSPTGAVTVDYYDAQNRQVGETDPASGTTIDTYDPAGNLLTKTTPGGEATYGYDADNRLTLITYSNPEPGFASSPNVTYTYDADENRTQMTDGTGTTSYTYDSLERLASTTNGAGYTVSYGYDPDNEVTQTIYPGGVDVTEAYDGAEQETSVTDWLGHMTTFSYDADGNMTAQHNNVSTSAPNGTSSTAFSYDDADQNTQASSTLAQTCGGNETLNQSFSGTGGSINADGQVTAYTESYAKSCSNQGSYDANYSYDADGRAVYEGSSSQGSNPNNFSYDAAGDPTEISSHDPSGKFDTYTQSVNQAGQVQSQTPISGSQGTSSIYSYDTMGDETQATAGAATTTYGFNQAGEMTSATSASGPTTYLYNGDGLEAASESNGTAVGPPTSVDASYPLEAVSCANPSFCVAVDNDGNVFTYNGTSWSPASSIDGDNTLDSVSCASSSFCVVVNNAGNALIYNGTSWSAATSIDGTKVLESVSCASSSFCMAVDNKGDAIIYNGTSWSKVSSIDSTRKLVAASCPTASFCVAVDAQDNALTYNGTSWSKASSIESPTPSWHCRVRAPRSAWRRTTQDKPITYNGTSWSAAATIDGDNTIDAVSCPNSSFCVAVDNDGNSLTYNGTSWSAATSIDSTRKIDAVSCPSKSSCAAVDTKGNAVTYGTTSWSPASSIDGDNTLDSVSCASSSFCVVVDNAGNALIYNGTSWSAATSIDGTKVLESVSCASSSFCMAVDNKGDAIIYNGTSWSKVSSIDSTRKLVAASCPTATLLCGRGCSGQRPHLQRHLLVQGLLDRETDTLVALSCASSSFCVATDNAGHAITYNGTSWSAAATIDGDDTIDAVSCPNSSFCVAVDNDGNSLTYNGTSWSAATSIDGNNTIDAVSCVSSSFCAAVDSRGNVVTYNGTSWSSTSSIDSARKIESISCSTSTSCTAVDSQGYVTIYMSAPTNTSWLIWDTNRQLPLVLSDGTTDYIYGPGSTPVEQVSLASSTPTFMTYVASGASWLITTVAGQEIAFYGYDAFGNMTFGTPGSSFGFAGEYTDSTTGFSNLRARWYTPQTGTFLTVDPAVMQTDEPYEYAGDDPVNEVDPLGLWDGTRSRTSRRLQVTSGTRRKSTGGELLKLLLWS